MKTLELSAQEDLIDFQYQVIELARSFIESSAARFWMITTPCKVERLASFNIDKRTEADYQNKYGDLDPMHPSRFEDEDTRLVCSNTLMSEHEWKNSSFYTEFMAPRYYDHDVDIFFRSGGKIVAVLSILREDSLGPFREDELALLDRLQPFVEFSLNSICRPRPATCREYIHRKYPLTDRELDVAEIVLAGVNTKTVARELHLSIPTVKTHLQHIFEKVGVHSTKELISTLYRDMAPALLE